MRVIETAAVEVSSRCTANEKIVFLWERGKEGRKERRLKVSYTKVVHQHKHRDHEEYWC
jgi:hypothetical protein